MVLAFGTGGGGTGKLGLGLADGLRLGDLLMDDVAQDLQWGVGLG